MGMKADGPRNAAADRNREQTASDGLFGKLAELFLGSSDPEKERRRLLKQTGKALRKLNAHYYNPKTEQAEAALARLFYEFYKAFASGQRILRNARNSAVLKSVVIDSTLDKDQLALKESLSEESLRRRTRTGTFEQLRGEVEGQMGSLFSCFDINKTKQINDTYASVSVLLDLILFDYYYFLRKFDPQITETRRDYVPRFRATSAQYVAEELEEFLEILPAVDLAWNWLQVLDILKAYRGVEAVSREAWKRVAHLIRRLQSSRELELAVQLFSHNPYFKPKPKAYRDNLVEEFLSRFRLQTEATLQKLAKEHKTGQLQSLVSSLFDDRSYLRLKHYNEDMNRLFAEKLLGGFTYVLPLNCLHSFLADHMEADLGKAVEFLLIPAKWADNGHSRTISDSSHQLQAISREILALDAGLNPDQELGRRLASVASRSPKNQQAQYLARRIIKKINDQSRELLVKAAQATVLLGKELKLVIDDTKTNNSQLIINWRDLTGRSTRDPRQMLIASYKQLYSLVQLFRLYV